MPTPFAQFKELSHVRQSYIWRRSTTFFNKLKNKLETLSSMRRDIVELIRKMSKYRRKARRGEDTDDFDMDYAFNEMMAREIAVSRLSDRDHRYRRIVSAARINARDRLMRGQRFDPHKHPRLFHDIREIYYYYPNIESSEVEIITNVTPFEGVAHLDRIKDWILTTVSYGHIVKHVLRGIINAEQMGLSNGFWKRKLDNRPNARKVRRFYTNREGITDPRDQIITDASVGLHYKVKIIFYIETRMLDGIDRSVLRRVRGSGGRLKKIDLSPTYVETFFSPSYDDLVKDLRSKMDMWRSRYSDNQLNSIVDYQVSIHMFYMSRIQTVTGSDREKAIQRVTSKYFIRYIKASLNCLYASLAIALHYTDPSYYFPESEGKPADYVLKAGRRIKTSIKKKFGVAGERLTKQWVKNAALFLRVKLTIYNFEFKKCYSHDGRKRRPNTTSRQLYRNAPKHIRLWVYSYHAYPLIVKKSLHKRNIPLYNRLISEHKALVDGDYDSETYSFPRNFIVPTRKESNPIPPDGYVVSGGKCVSIEELGMTRWTTKVDPNKVVAYDLETVIVDIDGTKYMKCYAIGLAFRHPGVKTYGDMCDYLKTVPSAQILKGNCHDGKPRSFILKKRIRGKIMYFTYNMVTITFFSKEHVLDQCFEFVSAFKEWFKGSLWYAHNGGKFDFPVMIRDYFFQGDKTFLISSQILYINNRYISVVLKHRRDQNARITLKDTCASLMGSLDYLTKEVNKRFFKLPELVDHTSITIDNFNTFPMLRVYLQFDCLSLYEMVMRFREYIFEIAPRVDFLRCYTAANISKRIFMKHYYDPRTPENRLIHTYSEDISNYIIKSYFGGCVNCFMIGAFDMTIPNPYYKSMQYMDFTSSYPACGQYDLPVGKPQYVSFSNNELGDFFGFVKVKVKTINRLKRPLISYHDEESGLLVAPIFAKQHIVTLFSEELLYAKSLGIYEFELIDGYKFKRSKVLSKFFGDLFGLRAKYKKEGRSSLALTIKIIINSGYGYWGMRCKNRVGLYLCRDTTPNWRTAFVTMLNDNKVIDYTTSGEYNVIKCIRDLSGNNVSVGIASAITSYARMKLYKLMVDVENEGGEVVYCDTDSVIVGWKDNRLFEDRPTLVRKHMEHGGLALGETKNELGYRATIRKCLIAGNKFYAIIPSDDHAKHLVKTKGLVKKGSPAGPDYVITVSSGDIEKMINESSFVMTGDQHDALYGEFLGRKRICQRQVQFRQSIRDTIDRRWGVRIEEIDKKVGIQYDKGYISKVQGRDHIYKTHPILV